MKRNSYVLPIEVELTESIRDPQTALEAAGFLAGDIAEWLKQADWGIGVARVESVYVASSLRIEAGQLFQAPRYAIAWDDNHDDPNPHALNVDPETFSTFEEAAGVAERLSSSEDDRNGAPWTVVSL